MDFVFIRSFTASEYLPKLFKEQALLLTRRIFESTKLLFFYTIEIYLLQIFKHFSYSFVSRYRKLRYSAADRFLLHWLKAFYTIGIAFSAYSLRLFIKVTKDFYYYYVSWGFIFLTSSSFSSNSLIFPLLLFNSADLLIFGLPWGLPFGLRPRSEFYTLSDFLESDLIFFFNRGELISASYCWKG